MLTSTGTTYTRVAVVQLAYHPAALVDRRSPLEDPLFDPRGGPDALLPRGDMPDALAADLAALRARVRNAHNEQLLAKLRAVLGACCRWGVRLVVLPEYSVPWEILGGVADAADEIVVVAGTHAVDRAARRSGIYERLVAPALPGLGQAVCPVLHRGRLLVIQPKLHPALPEQGSMKPGETWAPLAMPDGIVGPLGILVCLDFLYRENEAFTKLVAGQLGQCRFLAVPSLTPHYTLPEFAGKAWEEARRYGRPVLYCDGAEGGGTAIYVDEGQPYDLRRFPDRAGFLEPGDEGMIVADVNLGYERPGRSTRYAEARPVVPVAEATFVYRAHPAGRAYAEWLEDAAPLLARDDDEALEALDEKVKKGREMLLNAGALIGAAARGRRLRRLVAEIENITRVEEIRQFTREVVLPEGVLPLGEVRRAMAAGAADAVFEWMKRPEVRAAGFGEVEARLREAGAGEGAAWSKKAEGAAAVIAQAVRGAVREEEKAERAAELPVRVVLPRGLDPAALGTRAHGSWTFVFRGSPEEFHETYRDRREQKISSTASTVQQVGNLLFTTISDFYLLVLAEGATRTAVVEARHETFPPGRAIFLIVSERDGQWTIHSMGSPPVPDAEHTISAAMAANGLVPHIFDYVSIDTFRDRMVALLPRFELAAESARSYREQRLREVKGEFVEPDARYDDGFEPIAVLRALTLWLFSPRRTALLLGEFGSGKSTALAEWTSMRWQGREAPYPLLVNLAGTGAESAPEPLLLETAKLPDTRAHRAALRLLIHHGFLVPCFDGFDEMATRIDPSHLANRLSLLLEVASIAGKVIISSRTNYFPSKEHLRTTTESALAQTIGASAGLTRIEIQPFSDEQVTSLVRRVRPEEGEADEALARIAHIYDLRDLVHRPLLLGMILNTLDSLGTSVRIGRADLYDAYLERWLDQTRKDDPECFTDAQKMAFAEALAEELWRSGEPSCTWQDLGRSVRLRLLPELRDTTMPIGAALLEMQGGAFFVHEGEDRYRFAHKSFLEYFLARALVATVADRPAEVLATRPLTPEVVAFVGEILRRAGDPREARAARAVSAWLTGESTAAAAPNALRLLVGLARWADDGKAWMPEGADLRGATLVREDLRGASLVRVDLSGADLSGADLSGADLSGATLEGARLAGVRLEGAKLVGVIGRGADFTLAEADSIDLSGADLTDAVLRQSMWTACTWRAAKIDGVKSTAWIAPGNADDVAEHGRASVVKARATVSTGPAGRVTAAVWSPDTSKLAIADEHGIIHVWSMESCHKLLEIDAHSRSICALAWSPCASRLAAGGRDGSLRILVIENGAEALQWQGHQGALRAVGWSPDGARIVTAGDDGAVRVWDTTSAVQVTQLHGHEGTIGSLAWSSNGDRIAGAGKLMWIWNVSTPGDPALRRAAHEGPVRIVAWSQAGRRMASAGEDAQIRIWDALDLVEIGAPLGDVGDRKVINALSWSDDGSRLATADSGGMICAWDIERREAARNFDNWRYLNSNWLPFLSVAWSKDGTKLFTVNGHGHVYAWSARGGGREMNPLGWEALGVTAVAWSPDGTRLACAGPGGTLVVSAVSGEVTQRLLGSSVPMPQAVAWNPRGDHVALGGDIGVIALVDLRNSTTVSTFQLRAGAVRAIAWHPSNSWFASVGDDGALLLWDENSAPENIGRAVVTYTNSDGTKVQQAQPPIRRASQVIEAHRGSATVVCFHPDGALLATAGKDGRVCVWGVPEGELKYVHEKAGSGDVGTVGWSATGSYLAGCGLDGTVWISGARTGVLAGEYPWNVQVIVWHPRMDRIAGVDGDGTLFIWEVPSGNLVLRVDLCCSGGAKALDWNRDGWRLAIACDDGAVRIVDTRIGVVLGEIICSEQSPLTRTPGGFCLFGRPDTFIYRLALPRPEPGSRTALYVPLAGLRRVLHRPDKVRAALAGDLSGDDIRPELEQLGWADGVPWDGKVHRIPKAAIAKPALIDARNRIESVEPPPLVPLPPPDSPFRPGRAFVESVHLPGRAPVLADLLALIENRIPAILRGPRRAGKTSILYHLKARLVSSRVVRHVTLEGWSEPLRTSDDLAVVLDPTLRGASSPASALRTKLRQADNAVLLLDEVANLRSADASVFAWLRAIGQEGTSVVLAGSHWDWVRVVEQAATAPGSSFGNDVTPVNLGPISEADALRFLVETAPPDVPLAADGTTRWILDLCGPWPFYLQVMGFAVVQAVREGERRALVEQVGVRDLYDQRLLLDRSAGYFATRWAELPERAQRVLETITSLPVGELPRARDLPHEDLGVLQDTGLCDELDRWLPDRPFYDWIRRIHRRKG